MTDELTPNLEKFNTGSGFYFRINELFNYVTNCCINNNKFGWYIGLIRLKVELMAKLKLEDERLMLETKYQGLVKNYHDNGGNVNKMDESLMIDFEEYLRDEYERKGMLSPLADDPRFALGK